MSTRIYSIWKFIRYMLTKMSKKVKMVNICPRNEGIQMKRLTLSEEWMKYGNIPERNQS